MLSPTKRTVESTAFTIVTLQTAETEEMRTFQNSRILHLPHPFQAVTTPAVALIR